MNKKEQAMKTKKMPTKELENKRLCSRVNHGHIWNCFFQMREAAWTYNGFDVYLSVFHRKGHRNRDMFTKKRKGNVKQWSGQERELLLVPAEC